MLIVRGVNLYPSQIESVLVGFPRLAPHYQLVLERRASLDRVRLEVEAERGVPCDAATYAEIATAIEHHLKSMLGIRCEIAVKEPGVVPRSQGKAVRVRDLRLPEQ